MANREYFQNDSRQDSYEFVGRQGPDQRGTSPYPPNQQQGYGGGNDPYGSNYGSQQQGRPSYGGQGGGYNQAAPPSRYEPGGASSPPPAYGQNDPYASQYQQQFGGGQQHGYGQQQGYNQRPQEYPDQRHSEKPHPAYGQQEPAYGQVQQGPGGAEDGERGFLGAVGGAAAGGFGGHYGGKKMNHGVLGTVGGALGGAIAGSMLQDHFKKDKHDEENKHGHHGGPPPQQHYGGGPPPQHHQQQHHNFAGNFSGSSSDISLDRDYDLIARCGDGGGGHRLSSIHLNDFLTNEFGTLKWQRNGNFAGSARNVRLADGGRVLEAELADGGGGWKHSFIYLDEKITNENGELRYLD